MVVKCGQIGKMKGAKLTGKDAVEDRQAMLLVSGGEEDDIALRRFAQLLKVSSLSELVYLLDGDKDDDLEGAESYIFKDND